MGPKTGHRYPGSHTDGDPNTSMLNDFAQKLPMDQSKEEELGEKIFISVN
jgi:hypothetical protein